MDNLKKNGFVISVIVMVLILGAAGYFRIFKPLMDYDVVSGEAADRKSDLAPYAKKGAEIPTEALAQNKMRFEETYTDALTAGTGVYSGNAQALAKLQFEPGQAEISEFDSAGIQTAFNTAVQKFITDYEAVRKKYFKVIYPESITKEATTPLPALDIPIPNLQEEGGKADAAKICHITRSLLDAATKANWGGLTYVKFDDMQDKRRRSATTSSASRPNRRGGSSRSKATEVKPIDPSSLYERVGLTIAGEIRYEDLGSFLRQLYLRAQDSDNAVFFVVEKLVMTKQRQRVLEPTYTHIYGSQEEAEQAPLSSEITLPSATMRMELGVLEWKGFPKEPETPTDSRKRGRK